MWLCKWVLHDDNVSNQPTRRLTEPSLRMKHIKRLRHTNPTCKRDCTNANGSPVLADTLNWVTLMTSATNGNMFFRREGLWFHICLGLKWEQLSHTCTVTLAACAFDGVQAVFCLFTTYWHLPYNWGKPQKRCESSWAVYVKFVVSSWPPCYRQPQLACWFPVFQSLSNKVSMWFRIQQY
jgi:hypothetical protein